jgi:hypothetical protein
MYATLKESARGEQRMAGISNWFRRKHPARLIGAVVLLLALIGGTIWGISAAAGKKTEPAASQTCPLVIPPVMTSDQPPVTLNYLNHNGKTVKIGVGVTLNVVLTYETESGNAWTLVENSDAEVIQFMQSSDNTDNT